MIDQACNLNGKFSQTYRFLWQHLLESEFKRFSNASMSLQ